MRLDHFHKLANDSLLLRGKMGRKIREEIETTLRSLAFEGTTRISAELSVMGSPTQKEPLVSKDRRPS